MSELNRQCGGSHYLKMGMYQPWLVLHACLTPEELKGAMKATVLPYLMREADKGGRLDIEKAYHTMGIYLELTEDKPLPRDVPPRGYVNVEGQVYPEGA